ncbi:MAG: hypothetical protein WBM17_14220 [Anaerolineales bacterium]
MQLLERLRNNKGSVSSALGKTLANQILAGDSKLLDECVGYSIYRLGDKGSKHIRSGAGKAVELVAEKKPELVRKHLPGLLFALDAEEPQTRWAIIRTMGYCARVNERVAEKAIPYAQKFISEKEGLCLSSSADLFLGDIGSISRKNAKRIFPIMEKSISNCVENEQDWILVALDKLLPVLGKPEMEKAVRFANKWKGSSRKSTQKRARNILEFQA